MYRGVSKVAKVSTNQPPLKKVMALSYSTFFFQNFGYALHFKRNWKFGIDIFVETIILFLINTPEECKF